MMRYLVLVVFSVAGLAPAAGQNKYSGTFKLPHNAQYARGRVLVKVKSGFKEMITQLGTGKSTARVKNISVLSVAPLVKPELARQGAARMAPRIYQPKVDISRYFAIAFDPARNIEDFINQLYGTGYFDIIEPEYAYHTTLTPNDPQAFNQYYLNTIKALDAWDITQGDTTITIAIVDSGGNLTHPDLIPNLYTNWTEFPPNGIDDDGNGFIDDYRGWDFVGADTLNLFDPNFIGDNNPNNNNVGILAHGTMVAGCAAAATNDNFGIAGVGFKTKIMFTKHSADNQKPNGGVFLGFDGILYAANLGIKIINCSWGGSNRSQIMQDIINHVTLDLGSLVVASAGNAGDATPEYPAAYDHVVSVAATDKNDKKADFSSFGGSVDLSAPGVDIYTTYPGGYIIVSGTSFSSPITSGAAALLWAKNPTFSAMQIAEQLRVSSDDQALYATNSAFANKLGKGRLDILRALTIHSPSLRAANPVMSVADNNTPDKVSLSFDFTNYLENTSGGLQISITSLSRTIATVTKGTINPGMITGNSTVSNKLNPFELRISPTAPENSEVQFLINYSDVNYSDYQFVTLTFNPSFINITTNKVSTTVSNIGRLGFQNPADGTQGLGFVFDQQGLLFEMGLIMGSSPLLFNNVRGINDTFDQDFVSTLKIKQITPGERSSSEISGEFSNSANAAQKAVVVGYRSLVWEDSPYDQFVILEYKIKNPTSTALTDFHFGLFADWDIGGGGQQDVADWDDGTKLGYVHPTTPSLSPYAGIQVLTGPAGYYAIDNDPGIPGNPFGLYDGFTDAEKFVTISNGIDRRQAGVSTSQGNDVSHVVSSGPYNINPGEEITVAFALHAAKNLDDLKTSARWADSVYNFTFKAPKPFADSVSTCYGSPATLNAAGASVLKWYTSPVGGVSFFTGPQFTTGNLFNDTTFYVSNADSSFESIRTPIVASVKANPTIATSGSTTFCEGNSIKLSIGNADSILWSTGATTPEINVSVPGNYFVTAKDTTLHCQSSSVPVTLTVNQNPQADFTIAGDLSKAAPISFSSQSTGAVSWSWDFGDGAVSTEENPEHAYTKVDDFVVKLTVTSDQGCKNSKTIVVSLVTGLVDSDSESMLVYPNPVAGGDLQIEILNLNSGDGEISLTNMLGQAVFERKIDSPGKSEAVAIPVTALPPGIYLVRWKSGQKIISRKIMRVQ